MRRPRWVRFAFLVLSAAVAVAPASASGAHRSTRPVTFASCAELTGYAQRHFAVTRGVPEPSVAAFNQAPPAAAGRVPLSTDPAASGLSAPTSANAPTAANPLPSYSTTNVQEAGVDEPDIVKTDGKILFISSGNTVYAVTVAAAPKLVGSLGLGGNGYNAQLLLRGTRLIAISSSGGNAVPLGVRAAARRPGNSAARTPTRALIGPPGYGTATTTMRELDVHDPAAMKVTRTMTIDGTFVDARQNGATARLVISSAPRAISGPSVPRGKPTAWVPSRRFHSALSGRSYLRPVAPCQTIRRPVAFSGLGMLTIFTLDLDRGLYTADTSALMADAQVVYGSTSSLYVATQKWIDPRLAVTRVPSAASTVISRFDVSDPTRTKLVASGAVTGYVLNQFSLSEYKGYLRVATTSRPIWWGENPRTAVSQSSVTVLGQRGGQLAQVGQVSGLGAGQQIYSVRFVEDTGYVVTFHQVDPLYTVDLRNPAAPRVAGQLELAGYSAYLHPLAPGLLLGIGQAVGSQVNEPAGAQLELFDVSDPSIPRLIQRTTLGSGSWSEVRYDHHAFLFWPPTGLAVLPMQIYPTPVAGGGGMVAPGSPISPAPGFSGAIGYHVDPAGLTEVGRISHVPSEGFAPTIRRSVVVDDRLFTLSDAGVLESKLSSLAPQMFVAFPPSPSQPPQPIPLAGSAPAR